MRQIVLAPCACAAWWEWEVKVHARCRRHEATQSMYTRVCTRLHVAELFNINEAEDWNLTLSFVL